MSCACNEGGICAQYYGGRCLCNECLETEALKSMGRARQAKEHGYQYPKKGSNWQMGTAIGAVAAAIVLTLAVGFNMPTRPDSAPVTIPVDPVVENIMDDVPSHRAELEAIRAEIEAVRAAVLQLGRLVHQGPR